MRCCSSIPYRLLIALFCAVVLSTVLSLPASAQRTAPQKSFAPAELTPTIRFAGLPVNAPLQRLPYRDPEDWVVCATPEMLAPLGITFVFDKNENSVTLTSPDGRSTVKMAARLPHKYNGRIPFVPVVDAVEAFGGKCQFDPNTNVLHIRSVVRSVEMLGGQLRIKATLPVLAHVQRMPETGQVIVDLPGAEIGELPKVLDVVAPTIVQARSGQYDEDTARIVFDMKSGGSFVPLETRPSQQLVFNPISGDAVERRSVVNSVVDMNIERSNANRQSAPPHITNRVTDIEMRALGENRVRIAIRTMHEPKASIKMQRGQIVLDITGAILADNIDTNLDTSRFSLLRAAQIAKRSAGTRLVLELARVVVYALKPIAGGLALDIAVPRGAGGTLAGKTVVVDPGHGGRDTGAPGIDGTLEKNVNLAIGLALADSLSQAGANVILTRSNDAFPSLSDRSHLANRVGADFFIAVHCDSDDRGRIVNGSTPYFHMQVPSCRALAQNIADRLATIGGIRCKGARSDGSVYARSGFAVLRETQMTGVLVECGYMTNPSDVAMLNRPAMQKRIAGAITAGLRDYIEGNPNTDTRTIRPQDENNEQTDATSDAAKPDEDGRFIPDSDRIIR